jgi:hypothetical protein
LYRYAVLKSSVKAMMKNKGAEGAAKGGSIVLCSSAVASHGRLWAVQLLTAALARAAW